MATYVDELLRWPTKIRCFKNGSCHLTADSLEELHEMAAKIGLKRVWFQDKHVPHYDLTQSKRDRALQLGALFVDARTQARQRIATREKSRIDE